MDDSSLDLPWTREHPDPYRPPQLRAELCRLEELYATGNYHKAYYSAPMWLHQLLEDDRSAPWRDDDGVWRQWVSFKFPDRKRVHTVFSPDKSVVLDGITQLTVRYLIARGWELITAGELFSCD